MGTINHGYIERVKYVLSCEQLNDEIVIREPIGWQTDEKEFSRNKDYHGIFTKFSNSLKFIDNGADFIDLAFEMFDIIAKVKLSKFERHPRTDKWVLTYWGYLDLSTKMVEDNYVTVKFNSGGLEQAIKARENESVEVERMTTINGTIINPITENEVLLKGRRIFLKTKYEVKDIQNQNLANLTNFSNGNPRGSSVPAPITSIYSSHESAQNPIVSTIISDNNWNRSGDGQAGATFFAISDKIRYLQIKLNLTFKVNIKKFDDVNEFKFFARLATYKDGPDYVFKEHRILLEKSTFATLNGKTFTVTLDETITLLKGESLALLFDQMADLGSNFRRGHLDITVDNIKCSLQVNEDSNFESSTSKFYLAHDLLNQLTTITANTTKAFYSDYFGRTDLGYSSNGPGAFIGTTHGFAVRGFTKLPIPDPDNGIENLYKPMTTSFRDVIDSMKAVFNVGMGIEEVNGKERVRIEELSYFYNNNITIRLPNQVKSVKRSVVTDSYYPSIEVGYQSGGKYEEAQGLDEPNGKSNFTTIIDRVKNTLSLISKYRADSYGKEFARRKPFKDYSTEDTQYDTDVFLLDLKKGNNNLFEERVWSDDFAKAPTGIFSPDTANGLRFSPFNMLLRHGWVIASGLTKYPSEKVRYGSSTANSQLTTQLIGGNEYAENGNIINAELKKARFVPEWVEFEHECNFELMQTVQGTTVIQGKKIQNFYGTVEFINEKNQIEKGFLFNLKPNEKGTWLILKSNR